MASTTQGLPKLNGREDLPVPQGEGLCTHERVSPAWSVEDGAGRRPSSVQKTGGGLSPWKPQVLPVEKDKVSLNPKKGREWRGGTLGEKEAESNEQKHTHAPRIQTQCSVSHTHGHMCNAL